MRPDGPTPERLAKGDVAELRPGQLVRRADPPLERLMARGHITSTQHEAGNRLLADYLASALHTERGRVIGERVDYRPDPEAWLHRLDHSGAFARATRSMANRHIAAATVAIVIYERPLVACGRYLGAGNSKTARQTAGLLTLRYGLDALARHYGLIERRRGAVTSMRLAQDYIDEISFISAMLDGASSNPESV